MRYVGKLGYPSYRSVSPRLVLEGCLDPFLPAKLVPLYFQIHFAKHKSSSKEISRLL